MALPQDSRFLTGLLVTTLDAKLKKMTDNFFNSNALIQRLYQRAKGGGRTIRFRGGAEIRSGIIYAGLPAATYGRGQTFSTAFSEVETDLQFQWKRAYCPINFDNLDILKNAGSEVQFFDWAETRSENATMSLFDLLGYQIFGTSPTGGSNNGAMGAAPLANGVNNASNDWDGLYNAISDGTTTNANYYNNAFATYGGVTRNTAPVNQAVNGFINTNADVALPFSFSVVQDAWGRATINNDRPDLIITTQVLWNKWWERAQAADRNPPGPLRDVGFNTINFNGAEVVADSHVPGLFTGTAPNVVTSGSIFLLNTKYIELWLMEGADMLRRGSSEGPHGFPVYNVDAYIDQLICYGDIVVPGPRYQAAIFNVV
jgi:hypothetical protein